MARSITRSKSDTRAKSAILTVGSTHFTPLVQAALQEQVIDALLEKRFTRFTVQYGKSTLPSTTTAASDRIQLELLDFTPDIERRMAASDLVISHAGMPGSRVLEDRIVTASFLLLVARCMHTFVACLGAGSILAALRGPALSPHVAGQGATPQLIIVPNDSLMDSHQSDLADELGGRGWAIVASANPA